ncbi:ABC transporter substrate-binding protein [Mangrovihabitans endophyticus]|uniref:ABC transporter ATP-binding protein n=1 Tax=Mangrovihabitans endophyticus TaxID=1751298 RepID=A0A8J3C4J4_9ACTN|nr:ABC transporter substrate-binding protein [Mangrovihabitans endophyticus]GGL09398.1 ABC transporter ATP-binding protein [Mangrovihabitans endophyticus]
MPTPTRVLSTTRAAGALTALLLATSAVAGCGAGGAAGAGEVRIGLVFPTTGAQAALGTDQSNAAKMMLEWANDHGGVGGATIKIFEGDSQSNPGVGATVAQRMIDQNRVQVVIGSYASGIAQAIAPVARRNKVVLWEVGAVAPDVAPAGDRYFLRTVGAAGTYATADLDFLENYLAGKIGKPLDELRVAVAHEDGPFGTSVADAVVKAAAAKGITPVATEAYPETSADMTPTVLRLKAAHPDVLLITPLVASTPLFWQAARTQNFEVEAIIGSAGFSSATFLQKFGARGVEGVYDVEAPSVANMNSENLDPDARAVLDHLRTEFKATAGHECLVHCGDGLGGAYVLVKDVLPRAVRSGAVTGDSIRAAAEKTDLPDGGTPQGFGAKFGENGDNTLAKSYIMQWQSGVLKVVWPRELAVAEPSYPMPTWSQR